MRRLALAALLLALAGCGTGTRTVTETTTVSAGTPTPTGPAPTYTGNGTKTIGTIAITRPSVISWRCENCAVFALTSRPSGTHAIIISSSAAQGQSAIDPGRYPDAQVTSTGDWSIAIAPG